MRSQIFSFHIRIWTSLKVSVYSEQEDSNRFALWCLGWFHEQWRIASGEHIFILMFVLQLPDGCLKSKLPWKANRATAHTENLQLKHVYSFRLNSCYLKLHWCKLISNTSFRYSKLYPSQDRIQVPITNSNVYSPQLLWWTLCHHLMLIWGQWSLQLKKRCEVIIALKVIQIWR